MPAAKGSVPWNAGTSNGWTDKRGYRWLYVTENGKRRARREHRVVVEQSIGRRLEPWEVVHHKDGNPSNNAIDNLEVVEFGAHTAEHHAGSRKSYEARRSMEAFALLREELKAERALKAELLEALQWYEAKAVQMGRAAIHQDSKLMLALMKEIAVEYGAKARAAIALATGESK